MADNRKKQYAEVWGDTLVLRELFISSILGVALTMIGYFLGVRYFAGVKGIDPALITGYALMTGILGCIVAGFIAAKLFKPKRVIEEMIVQEDIEAVLKAGGMSLEEEVEALAGVDEQVLEEMRELNLTALLDLRPATYKGGNSKC